MSPHEVESKAKDRLEACPTQFGSARDRLEAYPTQFGSKELVDPHKGRKVFQQIEKKARHLAWRWCMES